MKKRERFSGMTGKERILNLIAGAPVDRVPVMPITMMFAADHAGIPYGRYVTDYRALVDAQMKTAEDYGFDYVSCISDPAREAADCGAAVVFYENQPPAIQEEAALLADKSRLASLRMPLPEEGRRMSDRINAVSLFKEKGGDDFLIEGWVEGPCAEGADLRGINNLMLDFFEDPAFVEELFEFALTLGLSFARAQLEAGADSIGVGDAAASLIGPHLYESLVLPYEKKLVAGIQEMGGKVRLHICGDTSQIVTAMGTLGCDIVDLDWMSPLKAARASMGDQQVLAGNGDPVRIFRNGSEEAVRSYLCSCLADGSPRYILAAGCELVRDTPEAHVRLFRQISEEQAGR